MTFSVVYTSQARRDLKHLPPEIAQNCIRSISKIKEDPFSYVKKLKGTKHAPLYSIRIGEYRAIMSIEEDRLIVFVLEIGHRSSIYRKY
ncbi:MAG TPA: type II toxin-antitoxin system RelE/ParE family toxin [Methanomicrobiales archaeon]|jgi:mRNA interferase RelE/StbE|nr:type II toxin-antitoxin system RelE/ParE family toxin [Methanomicrobiales archaeon]